VNKPVISTRPMFRSCIVALAALTLAFSLRANGGTGNSEAQTAQAIQSNIDLLQFVTQTRLSPDERGQVAHEVTDTISRVPQNVIQRDSLIATTLTNAARNPKDAPRLRELWRYDIAANVPPSDIEYILAEKYDPVIVFDKPHQRIITDSTLISLRSCTEWFAQKLHKPAPDGTFIASERTELKLSYGHLTDDVQDAYAHVGRNCPHAIDFFNGVVAAQRDHFFNENAKAVSNSSIAATDAALISRIVYDKLLHRGGGAAAMDGRVFDYMIQQSLLQQQLQRTVIRNPSLPPPN
jgi:hypothetical protein